MQNEIETSELNSLPCGMIMRTVNCAFKRMWGTRELK